ncbi:MAG: AAA family ATPase [Anaeromyxobacteraceae bacterium]
MADAAGALIGRDAELADLEDALASAAAGHGVVRLVAGEPGIGKTHLADAAAARAQGLGLRVVWGRAWEAGGAPPLWPWREALAGLGAEDALAGAEASQAARFEAFARVRARLRALGEERPVLVVLDDLHAADDATLDLLLFVARGLRGARLALLATFRPAEARASPGLDEALARIGREGRRLELRPLGPGELEALASRVAPALAGEALRRVVAASEGNPLFAEELARHAELAAATAGDAPVAEGIRAVVRSRLARLPGPARRAVEAASVLGRTFELDALEALGADATGGQAREALALAAGTGIVAPSPGRPGHLAFSHGLVHEAVHAGLPPARRAALHHAHSLWLEARPGASPAAVAHHALLGLPEGPTERAVALARAAAGHALGLGAYADAASLLRRARDALGPTREPALRCDVGIALAEAEARAGLGERSRETAGRAADLARALGDPARTARAVLALGFTTTLGVVNAGLVRALREALAGLGDREPGLSAQLRARLASALQPAAEPEEPIALALEAVALARGAGDRPTLLATLYAACSALGDLAPPEVREPLDAECAGLAAALGDLAVEQRARARLAIDLVELGRLPDAELAIGEVEVLGERLALPAYRWRPALLRSMRALMAGDFAESERRVAEAARLAAADGGFDAGVSLTLHRLGATVLLRGRAPDGFEADVRGLEARLAGGHGFFALVEAALRARLGRVERLRALYEEALSAAGPRPSLADLQYASCLAVVTAAAGPREACAELVERLRPYAGREVTWGMMGLIHAGPLSGPLALVAAAGGDLEGALAWFEHALGRCGRRRLRPLEASLRAERATLLRWAGRGREAGEDDARAAELGAALALEPGRILACREALGLAPTTAAPPPRAPDAAPPAASGAAPPLSLAREGDVWAVRRGAVTLRVRHVRGLEMLALLVESPGRPFSALELDLPAGGAQAARAGDAGELLDAPARAAYRRRAAELREAQDEAERLGDAGRAARAAEAREALEEELSRALGLGDRARRAGDRAERSRVNVRRRLADAIARIAQHDPALGRFLSRAVRTGAVCVYDP